MFCCLTITQLGNKLDNTFATTLNPMIGSEMYPNLKCMENKAPVHKTIFEVKLTVDILWLEMKFRMHVLQHLWGRYTKTKYTLKQQKVMNTLTVDF